MSTRGSRRRRARIRIPRAAIIAGLTAFLVLASTGIAAAVWTSTASSLSGTVTAGTLAVTVTPADIAGLNATYSPSVLSDTAAISVTNSGTVPANYTVQVKATSNGLSDATTLTGWIVTSASQCTAGSAVGAQSGSAKLSAGLSTADSVAVGTADIFCVRTTIPSTYATTVGAASVPTVLLSYSQGSWSGSSTATATQTVADTVAPSTPGTPVASATTAAKTTLTWPASTDNVAVTGYNIYRNGTLVSTVAAPTVTFTDTGLVRGTAYSYTLKARDAAGNVSAASTATSVTTLFVDYGTSYQIANPNSALCLDAGAATTTPSNGTKLVIFGCSTTRVQSWQFVATTGGYFKIVATNTPVLGWDVDINGGKGQLDGQKAQLWSYGGGTNQQWLVVSEGSGMVHFTAQHSGKCLDINGAGSTPNTQLQQYACNSTVAQSFTLTALP